MKNLEKFLFLPIAFMVFSLFLFFVPFITHACACGPSVSFISPTPADDSSQSTNPKIKLSTVGHGSEHYAFTDFDDSLLSLWRFEGNPNDEIGGSDGVWNGTEDYDTGNFGAAGNFDGSSYVDVNLPGVVDSSFTVSTWVNLNTITEGAAIVSDDSGHLIQIGGSSRWQFEDVYSADAVAETGVWTHLVGVYNSLNNTQALYVNGENVASGSGTKSISQNINIGRRGDGHYINGKIDDVILFTRALGSDEISSLYDASLHQYRHTFNGLSYGDHTFTGYAVDLAGRTNTVERTFTLTVPSAQDNHSSSVGGYASSTYLASLGITLENREALLPSFIEPIPSFTNTSCSINKTLKISMTDEGVKCLQTILSVTPISGYFGPLTKAAVIKFQKAHKLTADGIVGSLTRVLLK